MHLCTIRERKTTTILKVAIEILEHQHDECLPLVIKARNLTIEPSDSGDLYLSEVSEPGYLRRWEQSEKRLLIVDGVDENTKFKTKLCQMLYKLQIFIQRMCWSESAKLSQNRCSVMSY